MPVYTKSTLNFNVKHIQFTAIIFAALQSTFIIYISLYYIQVKYEKSYFGGHINLNSPK